MTRVDLNSAEIVGEPIPVGSCPRHIAIGGGFVWTGNVGLSGEPGTISQVDAHTGKVVREPINIGGVSGIAWVAETLWVSDPGEGAIKRIGPESGQVIRGHVSLERRPGRIASGAGSVWAIGWDQEDFVARIDPSTNEVVDHIVLGGEPSELQVGADAVWVSLEYDNAIARIPI